MLPGWRSRAWRGVLVAAMLLAVALAGCAGGSDDVSTATGNNNRPPGGGLPGTGPVTAEGEGALVGVVLDSDFQSVNGARVRLLVNGQQEAQVITNAQGAFRMDAVPAGDHRLDVSASCCRDDLVRVLIEKDRTTTVNIRLEPLSAVDSRRPFAVVTPWDGFVSCGISVDLIYESCTLDLDPSDDRVMAFNVTEGLTALYIRMDWNAESEFLGGELRLQIDAGEERVIDHVVGTSPIEITLKEEDFEDPELAWSTIEGQREIFLRVDAGGVSAAWQQSFTVHVIEFYWMTPPEGFSFEPQ